LSDQESSSGVRQDLTQLIGRSWLILWTEKAEPGECPKKRGVPRKIELRQISSASIEDNLSVAPKTMTP
jgi:hypothetical protein